MISSSRWAEFATQRWNRFKRLAALKRRASSVPGPGRPKRLRVAFGRSLLLFCALSFASPGIVMAASCPYCGDVYGEPAPGDEMRVLALRAEHEANCPMRPRGGGTQRRSSAATSYGVVTIFNQTRSPVAYQIQLRRGGRWEQTTVQPGKSYYHWQTLPAQFQIRVPTASGSKTFSLGYNTVQGRIPDWQDGRPFYISGTGDGLSFQTGTSSGAKPKLSGAPCRCAPGCRCSFDSCGKNGGARCGCGGTADCDCGGRRCPKFAVTTACNGAILCESDGRWHCNRHGCPGGGGGQLRPALQSGSRFAGRWAGTVRFGVAGTFDLTLRVSPDESSVYESGGLKNGSHRVLQKNGVLSWRSGLLNEVQWTLVPDAGGSSARLTVKSPFGVSDTAIFEKQPEQ